ncbi:pregnancy zone protein [Pimephales promelas]|nr:pregnancy zone protein [Pimephales promelas]
MTVERTSVRPSVRVSVLPSVRACVLPSARATFLPCIRPSRHKDLGTSEWSSHGVKSPNTSLPILPKFDVTVYAPQTYSVAVMGLKVESCAKCTYGQPVPGQALVEVCRDPFPYSLSQTLSDQIMKQTVKMNATGCASLTVDVSVFFNTKFEDQMQDTFLVNVTEEGTVTVAYSFVERLVATALTIYMVLSKGVIILHGFQTVKAKAGDAVTSGCVTFQLSFSVDYGSSSADSGPQRSSQ